MDWDAISAVAEVISAIGVVVSLIYLAVQVRDSNRESRIAANGEIAREYNMFLQHLSADPARQNLWVRAWGSEDANLTEEERSYVLMLTGIFMRVVENAFLKFQSGRMEQRSWEPYFQIIRRGAISPSFNWYIEMREDMHTQEFVALLKSIAAAPAEREMFR